MLDEEPVLLQNVEDVAGMQEMFDRGRAEDEDVIEEDEDEAAEERVHDVVHESLEHHWRVAESERLDQELIEGVVCVEHYLGNLWIEHPYLVVARAKIKLGKEAGAGELVKELVHHVDRVGIFDCDGVECMLVDIEAPLAVSLLDELDRGGERIGVASDDAHVMYGRTAVVLQLIFV